MRKAKMKLNNVTVKYAKRKTEKAFFLLRSQPTSRKPSSKKLSKSLVRMPPQKQSGFLRKKPKLVST